MPAHLSRHFTLWHAGKDALHEGVTGSSHDRSSAGLKDGLFHIHRALHIVDDTKVLIICSILRKLFHVLEEVFSKQCNEAVWIDETTFFVNRSDAVTVTVCTHSEFTAVFYDGLAQIDHVLGSCRVCSVIGFGSVPVAVQVDMFATQTVQ